MGGPANKKRQSLTDSDDAYHIMPTTYKDIGSVQGRLADFLLKI